MSRKEVENKQKRSVNLRLKSRACTYATVNATSPEEAYALGRQRFENDDFKELTVTDWCLEHVSFGDKYWYKEDLHE